MSSTFETVIQDSKVTETGQKKPEEVTCDDMKETFLAMKGRPMARATFGPMKDVSEKKYFSETDSTALM